MADIRVQIPDDIVKDLQDKLPSGSNRATDMVRDALTLYNWAVQERTKGRQVFTTDAKGSDPVRLAMPSLDRVKIAP